MREFQYASHTHMHIEHVAWKDTNRSVHLRANAANANVFIFRAYDKVWLNCNLLIYQHAVKYGRILINTRSILTEFLITDPSKCNI